MTTSIKSSPDGTQAIIQVNGADKVIVDSGGINAGSYKAGSIAVADLATAAKPLGAGQTWQSFNTTTRAPATTYTNSTGRPIVFNYSAGASGAGGTFTLTVAGVLIISQTWGSSVQSGIGVSVVIPDGASYVYTQGGYTVSPTIAELR